MKAGKPEASIGKDREHTNMLNIKRKWRIYFCLSCCLLLGMANADCIDASYDSKPLPTAFSGYFINEKDWGPPNFGESPRTDSKFTVLLLKLDKPVTACATADSPSEVLDCVQVFPMGCGSISTSTLYGQHVTVSGTLGVASSPYEVTTLTMDCKTITEEGAPLSSQEQKHLKAYHCQSSGGGIDK